MGSPAVLFVGNLPTVANAQYVMRLFSAYGEVKDARVVQEGAGRYAEVVYGAVDDADSAIAALHCRYCASRQTPLIVLYHKSSPAVSEYGVRVGQAYAEAAARGCEPPQIALDAFDDRFQRTTVPSPPSDKDLFPGTRLNGHNYALDEGRWN